MVLCYIQCHVTMVPVLHYITISCYHGTTILIVTMNWEIFVYENIHVLNVRVSKLSLVPLNMKFCQVEITVHVLLIKLLAMYSSSFCYRDN